MTPDQAAAFVYSQAIAAFAEIEGMKAENRQRESQGLALAYDHAAFSAVAQQFGIEHNSVVGLFRDANNG